MKALRSRDNPLLRRLRALARSPRECRKHGQSLLDGPHLVAAALDADFPIKTLVVSESAVASPEIVALIERWSAEPACVPDELFGQISPVDSPTGIVALIGMPARPSGPLCGSLLVLDAVQDAGNLGSILRSGAAAGLRHALLAPGCAQAWSPRVLRAGMGAHFRLSIHENCDVAEALSGYAGRIVATSIESDAVSLFGADLRGDVAWLIGSEGRGVSQELLALAGIKLFIPMPGGTESLNVGAATAVCLFEQLRQSRASGSGQLWADSPSRRDA